MIMAPSTAGTGTEVTQFSRITDLQRHLKMSFISKSLIPDIAVIDPELLTTVSPQLAAATGMDALTHAIEAFVSLAATPLTNLHAMNAIELIFANLRRAVTDRQDMKANSNMALASLNAGIAFSNAIFGAGHAMTHQVDGLLDTHHGETDAVLLPHVMEFNLPDCRRQFREMAAAMGEAPGPDGDLPEAERAIEAVRNLATDIGLHHTLSDFGLTEELLPQLIDNTMKDACLLTNPRAVSPEDLFDLFRKAL
jgi:1,3-propanediol dehydrogenase